MNSFDQFYENSKKGSLEFEGLKAWNLKVLSEDKFFRLSSLEKLQYMCCFGLLAPSTHNTIPVRFKIKDSANLIELFLDRKSILPSSDPTGRQAVMSMGCAIENIVLAAKSYSQNAHVEINTAKLTDREERYIKFAKISFVGNKKSLKNYFLKRIIQRRVLRAEFDEKIRIEENIISDMKNFAVKNFPGTQAFFITDKNAIHQLSKYQEIADRNFFEDEKFTTELGNWFLPNTDKSLVGMQGKEFGLSDQIAVRYHEGLLKKIRLLPDEIASLATAGRIYMNSSPLVVIITAKSDKLSDWINAGQLYEYFALSLLDKGYFTAIHAAMIELERVNKMLGIFLKTEYKPLLVFRAGKPLIKEELNKPHSSRLPIEKVML